MKTVLKMKNSQTLLLFSLIYALHSSEKIKWVIILNGNSAGKSLFATINGRNARIQLPRVIVLAPIIVGKCPKSHRPSQYRVMTIVTEIRAKTFPIVYRSLQNHINTLNVKWHSWKVHSEMGKSFFVIPENKKILFILINILLNSVEYHRSYGPNKKNKWIWDYILRLQF